MQSKWLCWQPSCVGFGGSHPEVLPINQVAVRQESVSVASSQTLTIEKATGTIPAKPTKPTKPAKNEFCETRGQIPSMPEGVRLVEWNLEQAPVVISSFAMLTNTPRFVAATLAELRAAMDGQMWLAGHLSVRALVDRLEQCGVSVEIETVVSRDE